jgi:chromosomal replication initiator protein
VQYVRERFAGLARLWFDELRVGDAERGELVITAPAAEQVVYLERYCRRAFVEAAQTLTGRLIGVRFAGSDGIEVPRDGTGEFDGLLRLNGEYRSEAFVVGPCNRMAHAAAAAVANAPGQTYNPLLIHGESGVGKTHLVQAICHDLLDRSPAARAAYVSCELFTHDYIEAMQSDAVQMFHDRYRSADLLVIDDVQLLASRERSQEEFFHTFNSLHQEQRQVVLTADCHPDQIANIQDRLRSRLMWGLVARIDAPCLETRVAIVEKKAKAREIQLPHEVALFLAEGVRRGARELEGALVQLQHAAAADQLPITVELARRIVGDGTARPTRQIRMEEIVDAVSERFGVKRSQVQGRGRSRSIARPRQVCMYLARRLSHRSLQEIGKYFGGRDHTTVLHAERQISEQAGGDAELHAILDELERDLLRA